MTTPLPSPEENKIPSVQEITANIKTAVADVQAIVTNVQALVTDVQAAVAGVQTAVTHPKRKKKAAVVDDAFDSVERGEITVEEYLVFRQIANENGEFDRILKELSLTAPPVDEGDEISDELVKFLQILWERRYEPQLKPLIEPELFANKLTKLSTLETICQNLINQNLEVERINSKVENLSIFNSGDFVFVFIDYNLGYEIGKAAVENAKKRVKEIYNACPEDSKPVTILMSSKPEILAEKDTFQAESNMLEGVFRFSPKDALGNINQVKLLVRAYEEESISNHALQRYVNALTNAAKEALEEFQKEVRMMRIDDYVFIQNSALLEQAQPLGDYLAWLYGSHWANLLLRNPALKQQQSIIDKVLSRTPPLHHEIPSPKVSDIYMSALFEDELSPIAYHPLQPEGPLTDKPASALAELPYLHLGDLFTKKNESTVWMVLNAQCDLERANEANQERSIFLVQGVLHPLNKTPLESSYKTEFFKFNGTDFRIAWEVKKVLSIPHNKFMEWQSNEKYERHHRLRLPFALEIQQAFSASVTRVGLPVSPPFTQDLRLEVLFKASDGSASVLLQNSNNYAFQPVTRKEDKIVRLTLSFALDFKSALYVKKEELMRELGIIATEPQNRATSKLKYLSEAISQIEKITDRFEDLFFDKKGFTYPEANKISEAFKGNVSVIVDSTTKPFPIAAKTFFLFNIITAPIPKTELETLMPTLEIAGDTATSTLGTEPETTIPSDEPAA
ncbi:MAG: hypothetical protein ACRYFR_16050 [Janthinobacterium lividum]